MQTDTLQCISASYERILIKFYGLAESGPRTKESDFGGIWILV